MSNDTCPTWPTLLAWLENDLTDEGGLASQAGRGISRLRYSVPDLDTLRELVLQRLVLPSDYVFLADSSFRSPLRTAGRLRHGPPG